MYTVIGIAFFGAIVVALWWVLARAGGFRNPTEMSDQEVLAAIAGQADWLERQRKHSMQFGGAEPHAGIAAKRRAYLVQLCETLVSRHPEPKNLLYDAAKRAGELQSEGKSRSEAVASGVKQRLFAERGYHYQARWHP